MDSLKAEELDRKGYLTLNGLAIYLRECHPHRSVSYLTLQRYKDRGYIRTTQIGGQYRVSKEEIEHYLEHGTRNGGEGENPSPTLSDSESLGSLKS